MSVRKPRSYLETELRCYHCGRLVGYARQYRGPGPRRATFLSVDAAAEAPLRPLATIRCPRCGGPSFLDESEEHEVTVLDFHEKHPPPGRRRKPQEPPARRRASGGGRA